MNKNGQCQNRQSDISIAKRKEYDTAAAGRKTGYQRQSCKQMGKRPGQPGFIPYAKTFRNIRRGPGKTADRRNAAQENRKRQYEKNAVLLVSINKTEITTTLLDLPHLD